MNTALSDAELMRYARQILLPGWDIDAQLALRNSHVLIVGAGGLGCAAASLLWRAGAGRLTVVDGDTVDESNLQRQVLFWPQDIGSNKAQALAARLAGLSDWQQVNPVAHYADPELLERFLNVPCVHDADAVDDASLPDQNNPEHTPPVSLVLDCTDQFTIRDSINRACVQHAVPLLSAAAIGYSGQLLMVRPGQPCYTCIFSGAADDERRCADQGVLATVPNMMGNWQAHLALRWLGQGVDELDGRLLLWEGVQTRLIRTQRDPACPVCAALSESITITGY